MSEPYDPREHLTHDIQTGQVYGHARSKVENDDGEIEYGEKLRLVFADDEYVLLRSSRDYDNQDGPVFVGEQRDIFEMNASEGFYQLLEDVDEAPPMPSGMTPVLATLKRLKNSYQHKAETGGGRKERHKAEAMIEAIEEIEDMSIREMEFEEVSGVGSKTAENLREAGYTTDADIREADEEVLLSIGGVGQKNLENLLDAASVA